MYLLTNPLVLGMRNFAVLQPPLFVFTACLVTFGVTMLSMASDIENRSLANPDIELDWNVFLTRLSQLHYCVLPSVKGEAKGNNSGNGDQPKVQVVDQVKSLAALLPDISPDERKSDNVTVAVSISNVKFHRAVLTEPMSWHAVARGDMVGSRGKRGREKFILAMILWPRVPPEEDCRDCLINTEMCLIIQGPSEFMPKTKQPSPCYLRAIPPQVSREVKLQRTAADKGAKFNICPDGGVWTSFSYTPNPEFTVMLTRKDLLLVKERLQRSGFFLLAVSALIVIFAAFCSPNSSRRFVKLASVEA